MKKENTINTAASEAMTIEEKKNDFLKKLALAGKDSIKNTYDYFEMFTTEHDGKMTGLWSLSTNVLLNAICQERRKIPGSICQDCFACTLLQQRSALDAKTARNTILLTREIIPFEYIPVLPINMFRFESFADLNNVIQAVNYLNLVIKNPSTRFAWWSKNPDILYRALWQHFKGVKPDNLRIVYSSPFKNTIHDVREKYLLANGKSMIDRIFTVFTAAYALENNIAINCGKAHCLQCKLCYFADNVTFINEVLKSEQNKYYKALENKKKFCLIKHFYNGILDNDDNIRPGTGIHCYKAKDKNVTKFTEYELVNILVHKGKYDSYVIRNIETGKTSTTKEIAVI